MRVSRVAAADCSLGSCDVPGGFAALSSEGGSLDLEGFVLEDSGLAGLCIGPDAEADVRDGIVARNPIGANVQPPGFDLARIQDRVRYVDNALPLDSAGLPVPTPPALGGLGG